MELGKLLAEAQGEAITGQLKTSTLNLGYSHSHFHGHSRGHSHSHSHCQSHGYSSRIIGSYWRWPLVKTSSHHVQSKGRKK